MTFTLPQMLVVFLIGGACGFFGAAIISCSHDTGPQNRVLMAAEGKDRLQAETIPPICLQDILDMVPVPSLTVPIHVQTVNGQELPFVGVSTQINAEGEQVGVVLWVDAKEGKKP